MTDKPKLSVVTQIREGRPALNDIPGQLEALAEDIRKGEQTAQRVLVTIEDDDGDIAVFGYGMLRTAMHDVGMLAYAQRDIQDLTEFGGALVPPESEG